MFTPTTSKTERPRFRTEREYREWQLSLKNIVPVKRYPNRRPNILARLLSLTIR